MKDFWLGYTLAPKEVNITDGEIPVVPDEPTQFQQARRSRVIEFWSEFRVKLFKSGVFVMGNYEGVTTKQSTEKFLIYHDFAPDLEAGESVTAVSSITAIQLSDGSSAAGMLTDHQVVSGNKISYGIIGGTNGEDYKVTIRAATDQSVGSVDGGVREVTHLIKVRNR